MTQVTGEGGGDDSFVDHAFYGSLVCPAQFNHTHSPCLKRPAIHAASSACQSNGDGLVWSQYRQFSCVLATSFCFAAGASLQSASPPTAFPPNASARYGLGALHSAGFTFTDILYIDSICTTWSLFSSRLSAGHAPRILSRWLHGLRHLAVPYLCPRGRPKDPATSPRQPCDYQVAA